MPAPEPLDIDAPLLTVPEERGMAEPEIVDPMVLVPGMIPVYNPLPHPFDLPYNGRVARVRAHGVDLVDATAAEMYVGPDNQGGKASRFGLRRLYGPEPRFETAARNRRITVAELVGRMNEQIKRDADKIALEAERQLGAEAAELSDAMEADRR